MWAWGIRSSCRRSASTRQTLSLWLVQQLQAGCGSSNRIAQDWNNHLCMSMKTCLADAIASYSWLYFQLVCLALWTLKSVKQTCSVKMYSRPKPYARISQTTLLHIVSIQMPSKKPLVKCQTRLQATIPFSVLGPGLCQQHCKALPSRLEGLQMGSSCHHLHSLQLS